MNGSIRVFDELYVALVIISLGNDDVLLNVDVFAGKNC